MIAGSTIHTSNKYINVTVIEIEVQHDFRYQNSRIAYRTNPADRLRDLITCYGATVEKMLHIDQIKKAG